MNAVILILLSFAAGYALLFGGAVDDEAWRICQAAVGVTALVAAAALKPARHPKRLDRRAALLFGVLFVYVAIQTVPLPAGLVALLSPERAELSRAMAIAGPEPAWITLSAAPAASRAMLLRWLTAAAVFLLVRAVTIRMGRDNWWPVAPVIVLALIQAFLGFLQLAAGAPLQGTSGNRNHFAAALNLALPFAIALGASKVFAPALGGAAILAAAATLSLSRMGFLVALLLCSAAAWRALRHRFPPGIPALVLAGLLPAAFALAPEDLADRFRSGDDRLILWKESSALLPEYPLFGCGLGAYESTFQRHKRIAPDRTADYAHNDWLQLFLELGVIGFSLLAAGSFFLLRHLLRSPKNWRRDACALSLLAALLHSLTDYPLYIPANLLLFSWVVGVSSVGPSLRRTDILPTEP